MEHQTISSNTKRRRGSNRHAVYYRIRHRVGTSSGQPVPVGFYLKGILDTNGKTVPAKIVELFNTENDG